VTSWTGRSTRDAPSEVKAVYRQLKEKYRFNIVLFLLDSDGKLVDSFLPVPNKEGRQIGTQILRSGSWLRKRIATALKKVKVDPKASAEEKVNAPDVDDLGLEEGIRLTILFDPERGINYRMPTVEVVPFTPGEKKSLSRPDSSREVDASELGNWFKQIYPPGIMEKTGYVKKVTGALTLSPAGKSNAILKGSVTFFFDDRSSTTYKGGIELVVSYGKDRSPSSVKGLLNGMYPKSDRHHQDTNKINMTVLIESRPE
jgi:hypothetical protein